MIDLDGIPPEQGLIGALLLDGTFGDGSAVDRVRELVDPEDFEYDDTKQLYLACVRLHAKGWPIDKVTVGEGLRWQLGYVTSHNEVMRIRYAAITWMDYVPSAAYAEHYARAVAVQADQRKRLPGFAVA